MNGRDLIGSVVYTNKIARKLNRDEKSNKPEQKQKDHRPASEVHHAP